MSKQVKTSQELLEYNPVAFQEAYFDQQDQHWKGPYRPASNQDYFAIVLAISLEQKSHNTRRGILTKSVKSTCVRPKKTF